MNEKKRIITKRYIEKRREILKNYLKKRGRMEKKKQTGKKNKKVNISEGLEIVEIY